MLANLIFSNKEMEECKVDVLYVGGPIFVFLLFVSGAWRWYASRRDDDVFMSRDWMREQEQIMNKE